MGETARTLRECERNIETKIKENKKQLAGLVRHKEEVRRERDDKNKLKRRDMQLIKNGLQLIREEIEIARKNVPGWEQKYKMLLNDKNEMKLRVDMHGRIRLVRYDLPWNVDPSEDLYCPKRALKEAKTGLDDIHKYLDVLCKKRESLKKQYRELKKKSR